MRGDRQHESSAINELLEIQRRAVSVEVVGLKSNLELFKQKVGFETFQQLDSSTIIFERKGQQKKVVGSSMGVLSRGRFQIDYGGNQWRDGGNVLP